MMILPGPCAWKMGFLSRRLRELGRHLAELRSRVRETIAETVRETVTQVAREAVDAVLLRRALGPIVREQSYMKEQSYDADGGFDPWADEEEPEPRSESIATVHTAPIVSPVASGLPVARSALALALAAAGWWLGRRGSWWGAFAVGLVAGAAAAVTRRLTGDGLLLVQAAHEFLTFRQAFAHPAPFRAPHLLMT
jgi:hypothetical protein